MRGTVIPLAVLVLVLPGCGANTRAVPAADHTDTLANIDPAAVTTKIIGATPKQKAVLRKILAGLGDTVITEIRVGPTGKGWTPFRPNSVLIRLKTAKTDEKERAGW